MIKKILNTLIATGIISLLIAGNIALASNFKPSYIPKPNTLPGPSATLQEQEGIRNLLTTKVLPRIATASAGFVGGLSLVFVIIGGVRLATSYGGEDSVDTAKNQIIYGLVGFAVALLAYTIVTIIVSLEFQGDTTVRETPTETVGPQPIPQAPIGNSPILPKSNISPPPPMD